MPHVVSQAVRVLLATALVISVASGVKAQNDPGIRDTVSVDSVTAYTHGIGVVPVRFFNDEELLSLEVTLRVDVPGVVFDSFSFTGGRVEHIASKGSTLLDSGQAITVFVVPLFDTITTGNGLLGRLYLSYPPNPQLVPIDSFTYRDINLREHSTVFIRADNATELTPHFSRGWLDIQDTPGTLDSVWVSTVETEPGATATVDVNLYNERNLVALAVALHFDPARLYLDSVTFDGDRDVSYQTNSSPVQRRNTSGDCLIFLTFDETRPLPPGTGAVARLHFSVDSLAPPGAIPIDSTTYSITGNWAWNTFLILSGADDSLRITPIFHAGEVTVRVPTSVDDDDRTVLPATFELAQNYPNPFNPSTVIEFALPEPGNVRLEIYDLLGRRVRTLVDGFLPAGRHQVVFDSRSDNGTPLASGIYFYRLQAADFTAARKMLLVK